MNKVLLIITLLFSTFGQAFAQYGERVNIFLVGGFHSKVDSIIMNNSSANTIDTKVDSVCKAYGSVGYIADGYLADENFWRKKSTQVFEARKKELEKYDKRLSKGKIIFAKEANKAATLYSLGYEPICTLNYQKAANFYNIIGDDATLPIKIASKCCQYKVNGDKTPTLNLLESMDIRELMLKQKELQPIVAKFGLEDDFNAIIQKKTEEYVAANGQPATEITKNLLTDEEIATACNLNLQHFRSIRSDYWKKDDFKQYAIWMVYSSEAANYCPLEGLSLMPVEKIKLAAELLKVIENNDFNIKDKDKTRIKYAFVSLFSNLYINERMYFWADVYRRCNKVFPGCLNQYDFLKLSKQYEKSYPDNLIMGFISAKTLETITGGHGAGDFFHSTTLDFYRNEQRFVENSDNTLSVGYFVGDNLIFGYRFDRNGEILEAKNMSKEGMKIAEEAIEAV